MNFKSRLFDLLVADVDCGRVTEVARILTYLAVWSVFLLAIPPAKAGEIHSVVAANNAARTKALIAEDPTLAQLPQ